MDTGLLLEIKHIELGETQVLKVDMNTLVEIDPVLFSSSSNLSSFRLGWLEENLLQNLSKKLWAVQELRIEFYEFQPNGMVHRC